MTKFAVLGIWEYFPDLKQAEVARGTIVLKHIAYLQFTVAACFLVFAITDYFWFSFHPLEVAIVIDIEEKNEYDRALLMKLSAESEMNRGTGVE